jgi:hypothetical protein
MDVITRFRERGLQTPFDIDVLTRAGVSESLAPRVLLSLRHLDLIDEAGAPTELFERLRRAPSDEFQARLEEVIRAVYADVFQFADPTTDSAERVADAFRQYNPPGQRNRMVTLFLGLCQEAGIIEQAPQRTRTSRVSRQSATPARGTGSRPTTPRQSKKDQQVQQSGASAFPPELTGLLNSLPPRAEGWTKDRRDKFLEAFGVVLDFVIPVREAHEFEPEPEEDETP